MSATEYPISRFSTEDSSRLKIAYGRLGLQLCLHSACNSYVHTRLIQPANFREALRFLVRVRTTYVRPLGWISTGIVGTPSSTARFLFSFRSRFFIQGYEAARKPSTLRDHVLAAKGNASRRFLRSDDVCVGVASVDISDPLLRAILKLGSLRYTPPEP